MRILIILVLVAVIAAGYYWLIYKPQKDAAAIINPPPKEGSYCTAHVAGGITAGKIKNGVCVPTPIKPGEIPCGGILNPC